MPVNIGTIDQYVRIVLGLALVAYALQDGLAIQGWHWVGLIGVVLLVTAFFKSCPLYTALGYLKLPRPPVDRRLRRCAIIGARSRPAHRAGCSPRQP